jgi:hypothetical protein
MNPEKSELVRKELEEMKSMGVIEDSNSTWASPICTVQKPNQMCSMTSLEKQTLQLIALN